MTGFHAHDHSAHQTGAMGASPSRTVERSAYVDRFARQRMPPRSLWPSLDFTRIPELEYPRRLNCAAELLDRVIAGGGGARTVFVHPGGNWTYTKLHETANRIAHVLVEDMGLVPGNRVLLRGPNSPMMAACWFAVLKAGGIVVCTTPLLQPRDLKLIIEKAQIAFALADHRGVGDLEEAAAGATVMQRIVRFGDAGPESLETLALPKPSSFRAVGTAAEDVALIAFTSGTAGNARGTLHVHRDVIAICDCFPRYVLEPSPDDLFCGSPSLGMTYGLGGILLFPIRIGAATLLLEDATAPYLLEGIREHRATVCFTEPSAYSAMAALATPDDLLSLRRCVSSGAMLPMPTYESWREATGLGIIEGVSTTELLHIVISASGDNIRPGSTGKPVPGYEAKVIDERGEDLPPGMVGRLAVRGPTGCRYLDDHQAQRAYVRQGWNITGDSYLVDDDGYFWYQARSDEATVANATHPR